jgi:glycosyltransferase involved in cell wall biosynthesis
MAENFNAVASISVRVQGTVERVASRPIRVLLMDLLSIVPYYCGYLCTGFKQVEGIELMLGSIRYGYDPSFFRRMGLHNDPGLLDVAGRVPQSLRVLRRPLKLIECLLNLLSLAIRFLAVKPDVIHVQFIPLVQHRLHFELWFLKLARARGVKIVYTVHNILPHERSDGDEAIFRRVYALVDRFICHDASAKAQLVDKFQVSPENISVIPHGPLLDPRSAVDKREARARVRLPEEGCVVLWQGIIRPYKGIFFLLAAWKKAKEAGLEGTLAIVGTGEDQLLDDIRREVSRLGIDSSVQLVFQFVTVNELEDFYQAADIVIYPYSAITTSGALMTGIGYGKAVIASDLPAFQGVLRHQENALLVQYGDVENLAAALVRLEQDAELQRRLGDRLRESRSQLPTWAEIARWTSQCYRTVLSRDSDRRESKSKESQ